jgi:hypothetical protein
MAINIEPGMQVRYPRTGTNGTVVRLIDKNGHRFAELDSTGLLYRLDQLVATKYTTHISREKDRSEELSDLKHEKELLEDNSVNDTTSLDGACSGAG